MTTIQIRAVGAVSADGSSNAASFAGLATFAKCSVSARCPAGRVTGTFRKSRSATMGAVDEGISQTFGFGAIPTRNGCRWALEAWTPNRRARVRHGPKRNMRCLLPTHREVADPFNKLETRAPKHAPKHDIWRVPSNAREVSTAPGRKTRQPIATELGPQSP